MLSFRLSAALLVMGMAFGASAASVRNEPVQPITPAEITDPAKVELGKKLFLILVYQNPVLFPVTPVIT